MSKFDVRIFIHSPRITYYSKEVFYVDFLLILNLIIHLSSERDNVTLHAKVCNSIFCFSSKVM